MELQEILKDAADIKDGTVATEDWIKEEDFCFCLYPDREDTESQEGAAITWVTCRV